MERLSLEARVVYSFFLLFILVGLASSVWFWIDDGLGLGATGTQAYYLGSRSDPDPAAPSDGPELELPGDAAAEPLRLAKPPRQVVETFHFHLFSVSVCFLILGHIFMMVRLGRAAKVAVISCGALGSLAHLLVPVLVRFGSPGLAHMMFPTAAIAGLSWVWMTIHPLVEMWVVVPEDTKP
ncbi:MAG: hypothetical protein HYV07_16500 [Deltaproteobacteria bacterium]|nr:hypothetical protein [Deltaproteobacteria bacterium]